MRATVLGLVRVALMIASVPLAFLSVSAPAAWPACIVVVVLVGLARELVLEQQIRELASRSREEAVMAMSGHSLSDLEVQAADVRAQFERFRGVAEHKQRGER